MTSDDTSSGKASRAERAWIVVYALAAFVAGVGIILDAHHEAVLFVGELLAWSGIVLVAVWLIARGTPLRFVYPVMGVLTLAWTFRDVPPGGISADEVRDMVIVLCIVVAVFGLIELWDRMKRRRQAGSEESP
jgi:hypothetical protein